MSGRTGGKTNPERDHEQNVSFHPQNAAELADYLLPHYSRIKQDSPKILDACSGEGFLGRALLEQVEKFSNEPILNSIDSLYGQDIMQETEQYDLIICNPPWSLKKSLPIFNHLYSLLAPGGVMLFVINLVFCYQGSDRAEVLNYQKYYFLPRWTFKSSGRPLLDCGVMVCHQDWKVPK